jgi:hypothetical protein
VIKQILIVGAGIAVFAVAIVSIMVVLDVVAIGSLWESLGRIISIIAIIVAASVLIVVLVRLGRKESAGEKK